VDGGEWSLSSTIGTHWIGGLVGTGWTLLKWQNTHLLRKFRRRVDRYVTISMYEEYFVPSSEGWRHELRYELQISHKINVFLEISTANKIDVSTLLMGHAIA
jgi:hypothetical protein